MIQRYNYRHSHVFYRKLTRDFPKIIHGQGCWLHDENGNRYLDACGGAYTANLGHGVKELADAVAAQISRFSYVNGTVFTSDPAEELALEISKLTPGNLNRVYFLSSGSEAVEAALKLARQYWVEAGKPGKHKIIATSPGYHGNTLLALSASARGHYKKLFEPWTVPIPMIPASYAYRCPCRGEDAACPACSGSALEEAILKEGADTVAAFIVEPIGGSSTGGSVPNQKYLSRIREICAKHDVLFIADEVLTGAGRTGKWTAIEHFQALPDILILGKGLSAGVVPLSAVVADDRICDVLFKGSGSLQHAQTYSHTPTICAAGLATVRYLSRHQLIERCRSMGEVLHKKLAALLDHPAVGDVRGRGLLAGIEFVADKKTRRPFARAKKLTEALVENALKEGLVVWPNVGHADGENGDLVMVAPPFVITEAEIDEIVARLKIAIEKTFAIATKV